MTRFLKWLADPAAAPGTPGFRTRILLCAGILVLVSLLLYSYSLGNAFVWDSVTVFAEDPSIRDLRNIPSFFGQELFPAVAPQGERERSLKYYRPLIKSLHAVEYAVFGADPLGYNAVNIVLNAAVVVMALLFVRAVTGSLPVAFLSALAYAVLPVRVEIVSWAYSDSYLFVAFFSLLTLLAYRSRRYLLCSMAFVPALFSHESAVLLPVLIVLYELLLSGESGARRFLPVLYAAVPAAAYLAVRSAILGGVPLSDVGPAALFNTAAVITRRYVKMFLLPDGLITVYPYELFPQFTPGVALSYLVCIALGLAGVLLWRRERGLLFWYLWFFVGITVSFNIGRIGDYLMAEKTLNLASLGFCVLLAQFALSEGRLRKAAPYIFSGLLVLYAGTAVAKTRYWRDNATYLQKAIEFFPRFTLATYALANHYASAKAYGEAAYWYERTIAIDPSHGFAHCNLGNVRYVTGDVPGAVRAWERAVLADPTNPQPYYNLGMVREAAGDAGGALRHYRQFLARTQEPPVDLPARMRALEARGSVRAAPR